MKKRALATIVVCCLVAGCGPATPTSTFGPASPATSTTTQTALTPTIPPGADDAGVVWLCRPGLAKNPCIGNLSVTAIDQAGKQKVVPAKEVADPPVDCFYLYPTLSQQPGSNATLSIDPEEQGIARAQAALFSQVCNVYAPIYPQVTLAAGGLGSAAARETAYDGARAAFADYLARFNRGRGFVFIGHSQGAEVMVGLLHNEVDSKPEVRKLLVSALLLGGNVKVPVGKLVGGDFDNIPACGSKTETGCVVAYSSFDATPPPGAYFGRASDPTAFSFGSGDLEVLCVNPTLPGSTRAESLEPTFQTEYVVGLSPRPNPDPTTPYTSYTGQLTGQCKSEDGATWLQIDRVGSSHVMFTLQRYGGDSWGLHMHDVSLGTNSLVALVRSESASFTS
jgi:Protein of unknown function (DUF3089)